MLALLILLAILGLVLGFAVNHFFLLLCLVILFVFFLDRPNRY